MKIKGDDQKFLKRREMFTSISTAQRDRILSCFYLSGRFQLDKIGEFLGLFREEIIEALKDMGIELRSEPPAREAVLFKEVEKEEEYIIDHITFPTSARRIDRNLIQTLYVDGGKSTAQIAEQLDCSKTLVISTLKARGVIARKKEARTQPSNYRNRNPPYGYRVVNGALIIDKKELRICRMIVHKRDKGQSFLKIADFLVNNSIKNRKKSFCWHHNTLNRIYKRWSGKV